MVGQSKKAVTIDLFASNGLSTDCGINHRAEFYIDVRTFVQSCAKLSSNKRDGSVAKCLPGKLVGKGVGVPKAPTPM